MGRKVGIAQGLCECGCGERTRFPRWTDRGAGQTKGRPLRFVNGHNKRVQPQPTGDRSPSWTGGRHVHPSGYVKVYVGHEHPMAEQRGYVREHRLVMSEHLGRPLEVDEVVHHRNGDKTDNRLENLELFASQAEHASLHRRTPVAA